MVKVLMVCLGNICRSPMAEGILRHKAEELGLNIEVDSAGFESFHTGDKPDQRAIMTAKKYGVDISNLRARVFRYDDFKNFDYIYVMDKNNYRDVIDCARTEDDKKKVDLILNTIFPNENRIVPDPYYGGISGFENVFELLYSACAEIVENVRLFQKS